METFGTLLNNTRALGVVSMEVNTPTSKKLCEYKEYQINWVVFDNPVWQFCYISSPLACDTDKGLAMFNFSRLPEQT